MSTQLRWIAAAVAALAVGQVSAQGYYANPNYVSGNGYGNRYTHVVRCESYSGQSKFCRVNAQGRVFITRQLSQRQCIRGRNWNADYRGIWVGGGCRADFAIVPGRGYGQGGGYAAQYNGPGRYAGNGYAGNGYAGNGYAVNQGRTANPDDGYYNNGSRDAYRTDANRDAGYNDPRYGNDDPRYGNHDPRTGNNDPRYGSNDPRTGGSNDPRYVNDDPHYGNNDPRTDGSNDPRAMNNSRDDDRAGDQETCATPDENGYCSQPQQ